MSFMWRFRGRRQRVMSAATMRWRGMEPGRGYPGTVHSPFFEYRVHPGPHFLRPFSFKPSWQASGSRFIALVGDSAFTASIVGATAHTGGNAEISLDSWLRSAASERRWIVSHRGVLFSGMFHV